MKLKLVAFVTALAAVALFGATSAWAHEGEDHGSEAGHAGGSSGFSGHAGFGMGFGGFGGHSHFGSGFGGHSHFGAGFGSPFGCPHSRPRTFLRVPDYHRRPMMAPRRHSHAFGGGVSIRLSF